MNDAVALMAAGSSPQMALIRAGWRVVYEPAAVAWTEAPSTLAQLWRQRYRWSFGTMQADVLRVVASDVTPQVIANSGHWLMEEQPEATMAAIKAFL